MSAAHEKCARCGARSDALGVYETCTFNGPPHDWQSVAATGRLKPHEETWVLYDSEVICTSDRPDEAILSSDTIGAREDESLETKHARVLLAASAPEMARLLFDLEWLDDAKRDGESCPSCGAHRRRVGQVKYVGEHREDCPWLVLMRKAGVR